MNEMAIYREIVENALEMFVVHDEDGNILMWNQSALKEFGVDDLKGVNIDLICPQGGISGDEAISTERIYDGQVRTMMVYRKNLTCFRAQTKMYATGNSEYPYIVLIRNISGTYALERSVELAKEEALATAKAKSEFTANVTHELRTPVNGILGNTNILLETEDDPQKLKYLNTIKRSCNDMNALINSVLDFSKLEAGKFTLENLEFDFRQMIDDVKATHMPKITEKGLNFFVTISPDIPDEIIGDELRIKQILNNLLSNAAKFTHVGKISLEVVMTAREKNRIELFFMVVDTGIGIDKSEEDKLFKSFSQVDASVSRKYGGTGLGLNISKQLVELMGGTISVDSEKNKGTMFSFSIWLEAASATPEQMPVIASTPVRSIDEALMGDESTAMLQEFGTNENIAEINNVLDKLILCIEMENWEKAETFGETIKSLTAAAPKEIKTGALRLKMAIQKADYGKSTAAYETFKEAIAQ